MLVLSRKIDEVITIGDEVRIIILSIAGKQVRLGIEAPNDISVHREEIYKKLTDEQNSESKVNSTE